MSRRKQSNPKPIKRASDENECVDQAETIIFPSNELCLIRLSDDTTGVKSQKVIQKGTNYGPYAICDSGDDCGAIHLKLSTDTDHDINVNLLDEMGSWVQYIRQAKQNESSNTHIFKKDDKLWLEVTKDIEPGNELRAKFSLELPDECNSVDKNETTSNCTFVKVEPSSPEALFDTEENHESMDKSCSTGDMSTAHMMEESSLDATNVSDRFQFICTPCGIVFSSKSTLFAHQNFYCIHRKRNEDLQNETEEEKNIEDLNEDSRKEGKFNDHNKRSREVIEDGSSSSPDTIEPKSRKSGQIYSCIYCSYTADKKSSLNRHMRMHSSPSPVNKTLIDNQMLAAAMAERHLVLMRSYCAECDIQFTSHKNFAVHKQIYCNTRRVQPRSSQSSTSHQPSRAKSPIAQTSSSISSIDPTIASWNFLQKNAFPSSPLILVPCSYIPGRGLVPASSLMLQNGEEFMANVNQHDLPTSNEVVPCTNATVSAIKGRSHKRRESTPEDVVSSATPSGSEEKSVSHLLDSASSDSENSLKHSNSFKHKILARNGIVSKECNNLPRNNENRFSEDSQSLPADSPLDLTVSKSCKSNDCEDNEKENCDVINKASQSPEINMKRELDSSKLLVDCDRNSPLTNENKQVESIRSSPNDVNDTQARSEKLNRERGAALPVLVKQGVSNCAECNIVFYKHENYLAHKKFYCSARAEKLSPLAPENRKPAKHSASLKYCNKANDASEVQKQTCSNGPLFQFFCIPCGIKFSSIKNLRAHQFYYCPKRDSMTSSEESVADNQSSSSPVEIQIPNVISCMECKSTFNSELSLRKHLCSHCVPQTETSSSPQLQASPPAFIRIPSEKQSNALRCIVCGYRGHTLRGMKSHVRSHMSQIENPSTVLEEDVYAFVVHEKSINNINNHDINENSDGFVLKSITNGADKSLSPANPTIHSQYISGELCYYCGLCSYTSSYRGNVARHRRFVHKEKLDTFELNHEFDDKTHKQEIQNTECSKVEEENGVCSPPLRTNSTTSNEDSKSFIKSSENSSSEESVSVSDRSRKQKNFCKTCRISFSYLPSYIAHKQFYCTEKEMDRSIVTEK